MTKHDTNNTNNSQHASETCYNPKDHVEQIVALPEFVKLYENFQDEPAAFFSDQRTQKRCRRIYRFMEWAYPFLQSNEDAEAIAQENDTSNKLRKFLDSMPEKKTDVKPTIVTNPHYTVKETALKKTIQQLEDRISQIRRQLGEQ